MLLKRYSPLSETQKKRSLLQRMAFVHGLLLLFGLLIIARLMELQVLDRGEYYAMAQDQHFGGVKLSAQRGEILALNAKTNETTILATNTTLDLLYVDPVNITPDKVPTDSAAKVAERLADIVLTPQYHEICSKGLSTCPRELVSFIGSPYASAFDPLLLMKDIGSGTLLEPLPSVPVIPTAEDLDIPDITEVRRLFARDIERRISNKFVTFVPIKYSATKDEMEAIRELNIIGIYINEDDKLIFGDPEEINQQKVDAISRMVAPVLDMDPSKLAYSLRSRPLRYVPIMRKLTPQLSLDLKKLMLESVKETNERRNAAATRDEYEKVQDPLRSVAIIPEHWRFYPDGSIASHVVGFMNQNQEAQYGIEGTYDAQLRGQEGLISTVSDLQGGQILTANQTIIDPKDGSTIVMTIDPFIQKEVEKILDKAVIDFEAESAQAIVMDPHTGRVIAMANAPTFERNYYADVYEKTPIVLQSDQEAKIVVEIFNPINNSRIVKDFMPVVFSEEGRKTFSDKIQQTLTDVEKMYDLPDLARYYMYEGENARSEIFPTNIKGVWLKYKNNIGVGAYLNRTTQEIYEPGSVMKPITMAIAIDQGEVEPNSVYNDVGPVKVDEYEIKNALLSYYGPVNMTDCLAQSINTCMTSVSQKLGRKLFHRMIERFGFGRITNIELEDELGGEVKPWRVWSNSDTATASFGQGFSATPLQVITAFSALANGGKLMKPTIIDRIVHPDGSVETVEPRVLDQVITEESSRTISAMLSNSSDYGFAKAGKAKGHKLAGKTGTSQIAGPGGRYESGTGSTVNTFMGYAPPTNPKFILLVKIDRPKFAYRVFAESTSAPVFKSISTFLFEYYGIPPDEQ
jgi:cell division protein FtsI/penicillin-binding protein 2